MPGNAPFIYSSSLFMLIGLFLKPRLLSFCRVFALGVVALFWGRVEHELQEQNHLQEENQRQTSEIALQPPEYCAYTVFTFLDFTYFSGFNELLTVIIVHVI